MQLFDRTLGQWLEHWAEETPDKEYIVYSDRNLRFTWSQLNRRVDDMAKGLIAIGVERGTHVGIWAANVPDWLTLLYACAKIGGSYCTDSCFHAYSGVGVSLPELGYAYALYREWREGQ